MKLKTSFFTGLLITAILGYMILFPSCLNLDNEEDESTYFMIEVDSISLADTILTTDSLSISFYGTVGNNSCYSFYQFYPQTLEDTIKIEVWGVLAPDEHCTDVIVTLEGEQLNVFNFDEGTYFVHVIQPDASLLTDSLTVISAVSR